MREYFRSYSRPKYIVSDRGSCFTSGEFQQFLEEENVRHIKIATGSPQANGQVERVNRSLGPMIAKLTDPERNLHWDNVVEIVEYALNNTIHRTIKEYPSAMLFGVRQRGKVDDVLKEKLTENEIGSELKSHVEIREKAAKNEKRLQEYNKNYVNKRGRAHTYTKTEIMLLSKTLIQIQVRQRS